MSELKLRPPKEEAPTLEEPETKGLGPIRRSTERDERDGCATYRWNLSRPTCLPVIFKLAVEMAAA